VLKTSLTKLETELSLFNSKSYKTDIYLKYLEKKNSLLNFLIQEYKNI